MIKKLRKKLVMMSMLSLVFVLLVMEGTVFCLNYHNITSDADEILSLLENNDGRFPQMGPEHPDENADKVEPAADEAPMKKDDLKDNKMSGELPYESRYFSVLLKQDGTVLSTDTGKVASIDTETAVESAKKVWKSGNKKGYMEEYRYSVCSGEDDAVRIIFLNRKRELSNFQNLLITGVEVTVFGLLAVLLLIVCLSSYVIRPFVENDKKQKRFITDAGHELKTPLSVIHADAEVLAMDVGEDNEWIHDIKAQTNRLSDMTNDLILLARMEEGQQNLSMAELSLSDIMNEAVQTFQSRTKVKHITVILELTSGVKVMGDEKHLYRLISILLDNAVKYTPEGGEIHIILKFDKKWIRFCVKNTVEHIEKDKIQYLFERFYRTDDSRNSKTGGYGLGLSIAMAIVTAHRGKISAETADEKSLSITVKLPAVPSGKK